MFSARLDQGIIIKKIVEAIKDLVKNVNIEANPSGISFQAMDTSHVALVSLLLKEGGFQNYRCDRPLIFGLQIDSLFKILKCASNDDCIALSAEDEEPSSLKFLFENPKSEKISEFNLNLVTLDSEQLGIPETEYNAVVTLPSSEFSRICKELSAISETVQIEAQKGSIKFSVTGEIGSGSVTLKGTESEKKEDQVVLEVDEPVNLSFSLRFLNFFNKAAALSPSVTLSMSADSPLVVEFKIENLGSLRFYLAPKINDEEAN